MTCDTVAGRPSDKHASASLLMCAFRSCNAHAVAVDVIMGLVGCEHGACRPHMDIDSCQEACVLLCGEATQDTTDRQHVLGGEEQDSGTVSRNTSTGTEFSLTATRHVHSKQTGSSIWHQFGDCGRILKEPSSGASNSA